MAPTSRHFTLQHDILILDAYLREPLKNRETLVSSFTDKLLIALRMEELGALQIFDAADPRAPGWSFLIPITTSHISGHYFIEPNKQPHIRIDIYSCASVNWRRAIEICDEFFHFETWRATFVDRKIEKEEGERIVWDLRGEGGEVLDEMKILGQSTKPSRPAKAKIAAGAGK